MESVECVTDHVALSQSMGGGAARSEAAEAPEAAYLVGRFSFTVFDSSAILTGILAVVEALAVYSDGELKKGRSLWL